MIFAKSYLLFQTIFVFFSITAVPVEMLFVENVRQRTQLFQSLV